MASARVTRSASTLGVLLLLCACAQRGVSTAPADPGPPAGSDELVLQVSYTGGFLTPELLATRLPIVSVYADGRVLTEGPVPAIFPGPAWPNVQVQEIDRSGVDALVDRARAAGVTGTADLGTPPLADVPSTRFTLATAAGTTVREVYALTEIPELEPGDSGLTEEQIAARTELRGLLDALTDLPATLGPDAVSGTTSYEPVAVAAVVRPWAPADPDADPPLEPEQPEVLWPGPPLPGEPIGALPELTCVTATGEQARAVRAAAQQANQLTPWTTDGGARWAVTFRPLLPHESSCADLTG